MAGEAETGTRGLDHVVWAVHDIEAASAFLERLGFTLTPLARHPWGTVNRLVQLNGFFLELLTIGDESLIPEPAEDAFSFGSFNRDFLTRGEGGSMLVMESQDPQADRDAFAAAGLETFQPFSFERTATNPDGSERKVAFDLTFTRDQLAQNIGFFTCHHRYPQNFWQPAYQAHSNGVRDVSGAVIVTHEPASHHIFFSAFTGLREMRTTSLGIEIATPRGSVDILTPAGYRALYGARAAESLGLVPALAAVRLAATDGQMLESSLRKASVEHFKAPGGIVVPASECFGLTLIFD